MTTPHAAPPEPPAKLLFISHDANRSGAPILLLTFLTWLKRETDMVFDVLLLRDGPLRSEFAALGTTYLPDEINGRHDFWSGFGKRWRWKPESHWSARAVERLRPHGYAAVYGNSIVSLPWLTEFRRQGQAICLCHVHEMAWAIGRLLPPDEVRAQLPTMSMVIACANAVASDLTGSFGVPAERIRVMYSFVESDIRVTEPPQAVRARLGIGANEFVIGAVGTPELRKGTDLIVQLAWLLEHDRQMRDFRIVWLGGEASSEMVSICRLDAQRLGIENRVLFISHTAAPNDYINAFDALIVPSREEPFTLVALAAASLAKPIVGFARSGGIEEVLADGSGIVVPYLDLGAMADALVALRQDPQNARRLGANVRRKVTERFTTEIVSRQLHALIEACVAPDHRPAPPAFSDPTDTAPHGTAGS